VLALPADRSRGFDLQVMHTYWQCKRVFDLFLEVQRLTGADSHFKITRAAKGSACHCNGKAKAKHQGKGKE
jgi:hypothetical protein